MIRKISEKEFINENGAEHYMKLVQATYKCMKDSPEYKNDLPEMFSIIMFDWKFNDGRVGHIIIEANLKKIGRRNDPIIAGGMDDFGIVSMKLTDEEFPDEVADRYNEFKKLKAEVNKENENLS
jgi:hypothetical protein